MQMQFSLGKGTAKQISFVKILSLIRNITDFWNFGELCFAQNEISEKGFFSWWNSEHLICDHSKQKKTNQS